MSSKCADCQFWERWGTERGGCHRMPPITGFRVEGAQNQYQSVQVTITTSHNPIWPNTNQSDWCGEFSPALERPTEPGMGGGL